MKYVALAFWLTTALGAWLHGEGPWWRRIVEAALWPITFGILVADAWKEVRKDFGR